MVCIDQMIIPLNRNYEETDCVFTCVEDFFVSENPRETDFRIEDTSISDPWHRDW